VLSSRKPRGGIQMQIQFCDQFVWSCKNYFCYASYL